MARIVIDPDELDRFAVLVSEAADDYGARSGALRTLQTIPMPPEVAAAVADGVARVATDLDRLSTSLYAEAVMLRARAALLDPVRRRFLSPGPLVPPA